MALWDNLQKPHFCVARSRRQKWRNDKSWGDVGRRWLTEVGETVANAVPQASDCKRRLEKFRENAFNIYFPFFTHMDIVFLFYTHNKYR